MLDVLSKTSHVSEVFWFIFDDSVWELWLVLKERCLDVFLEYKNVLMASLIHNQIPHISQVLGDNVDRNSINSVHNYNTLLKIRGKGVAY